MTVFIVVPLGLIFSFAIQGGTENFTRFFEASYEGQPFFERLYMRVLLRSVWLAAVSAFICLILGYPAAYIMARHYAHKTFLLFLLLMPMWMNFLLRTYAWLTILEQNGVLNSGLAVLGAPKIDILYTDAAVILGMVYNFLPFMILPIYSSLKDMDVSYIEAAQDLGASPLTVFLKIIFPLSAPGVISGITMVFMPGVTTFVISRLLGGGQFILIGNLIEQQFLTVNDWGFGSAISFILIIIIICFMGITRLIDKGEHRRAQN